MHFSYLNLLHGCITQCPAAFCRIRSFMSAFLLPKSFIANLLSEGWKRASNWLLMKEAFASPITGFSSSFGVPYRESPSASSWKKDSKHSLVRKKKVKKKKYKLYMFFSIIIICCCCCCLRILLNLLTSLIYQYEKNYKRRENMLSWIKNML